MSALRSDRLAAALDRAVLAGEPAELHELLRRSSGLPGPRPNLELAGAVGQALARHEARADRLVDDLGRSDDEYLRIVAAAAYAARSLGKQRAPVERALASLQELAEDPRHLVRLGLVEALRTRIAARGEAAVLDLAAWTDGYLQAHVALEALADRTLLAALPAGDAVLARLDEAFALADASPRAAERSQGMRLLRQAMPAQIAAFAARFPETLAWLEARTASKRPETREVVAGAIAALRRVVVSDAEAERLSALLTASGKPPRDPSRVVAGTRKRGRGRR
jgi:hypothetical protein